jgi:glycosyltransferase involved in cell wall biosynthesis
MSKKKILFISDSVKRRTGYSTVARNIIGRLAATDKYDIAQLGFSDIPTPVGYPITYYSQLKEHNDCCHKGPIIEYTAKDNPEVKYLTPQLKGDTVVEHDDKSPCIKAQNMMQDHYGYDSSYYVIQHYKPDIVIPINDIWGLYNLNHLKNRHCYKFVPYLAIDSDCLFPMLVPPEQRQGLPPIDTIRTIGAANKTIVFTNWAKDVINKTCRIVTNGRELTNIDIIPHGVDTSIWKPLGEEKRKELRQTYFGINDNVFLIGVLARNQPRKRFDAIFMAMRRFIDRNYEKFGRKIMCYMHAPLSDTIGWDLQWLTTYYGLTDRVIFDKNLQPGMGPDEIHMNEIVNCFDVHMLLANSEGWGLPMLETAAAGVPNIVSDYSAHADWGKNTLLMCKIGAYEHEPRTGFIKGIADVDHAAHQLKLLYDSKKMCRDYGSRGVSLGKKLDWSNVCKQWETILDNIDVSDLKEDRYSQPEALPDVQGGPTQDFSQLNLKHFPDES